MLQFLAPVVGNLIGSLFQPKIKQPDMSSMGMDLSQGVMMPGSMPMAPQAQTGFNWSSILGGALSIALGGGGSSSMMSMGGMGGFGGGMMGMGNPFAMGGMMGGLGGFGGWGGMGSNTMIAQLMQSQDKMIDVLNGEGKSEVADANLNILDTAS